MEINVKQAVVDDYKEITEICIHDLGYNCSVELVKARLENVDNERERFLLPVLTVKSQALFTLKNMMLCILKQ